MEGRRVLFFFNHPAAEDERKIESGETPTERLYGVIELRRRGWRVETCEERFNDSLWFRLTQKLHHYGFNLVNFRSIAKMAQYDVVVVKDGFSMMLTLGARLMRKKLVYLDSLFHVPRNPLQRLLLNINIRLAPIVVCYSRYQVDLWSRIYSLSKSKFRSFIYSLDIPFYYGKAAQYPAGDDREPYVLSVGRDVGRDFDTMIRAARMAGLKVKLVTLPYLIPASARDAEDVEIIQRIPYEELFRLYAGARMVVVPLKADIDYPSGIRAAMESLVVGRATICTITDILVEYMPVDSDTLLYVQPGDVEGMRDAMLQLKDDNALRRRLEHNGMELIANRYNMDVSAAELEALLDEVLADS